MIRSPGADAGFTLVEALVGAAITLAVMLLAAGLAVDTHALWRAESARADLQQRARAAADVLAASLLEAGAGSASGAARGPLPRYFPAVLPRRTGRRNADPPSVFRADAVTLLRASSEGDPAVLLLPAAPGAAFLEIAAESMCDLPSCGFTPGAVALVFDASGNHDLFTILSVDGSRLEVRHHGPGAVVGYPSGSPVIMAVATILYLDAATRLLRRYDGDDSDLPLLDDVVGFELAYYGAPDPPRQPRPPAGVANCLYANDGSYHASLFETLVTEGASQAPLPPSLLTDGPWCGSGATQYDADLLRVRRIRLKLRLQAVDPAVRGADPLLFHRPGFAGRSGTLVPDEIVTLEVTPRNLRTAW